MEIEQYISGGTPARVKERYRLLPSQAKRGNYGELDHNIVVIDTETTGFSFHHDELTQIAAARMEAGEIVDWFITFVNPGQPIPDEVAHLTNIHDADVENAPSPDEALGLLVDFVGDAVVVAHNAEFDRTFTTRHPSGYPLLENVWIDSLDLARIALPRLKSHRLIDLVKAFDAPVSTHRADADVAATCALFRILLAAVDAMPKGLVREIARLAPHDVWQTAIVFEHFAKGETEKFSLRRNFVGETKRVGEIRETQEPVEKSEKNEAQREGRDAEFFSCDGRDGKGTFPTAEEIDAAFSSEGIVGSLYDDYETRDEQRTMAQAIRDAFLHSENLMVEAGTGVGKSMAYLVPAVLLAKRKGVPVGVATKTNALLDQLIYQELPALMRSIPNLSFAALKGFSHYPCLRKVKQLMNNGAGTAMIQGKECSQAPALAALLSFIEQTDYDDIDGLKIDYRVLPRRQITTTSNECLRRKCAFFDAGCFIHGCRRSAERADIVVTNHSLLFCDAVVDGGLLPSIRYWVIDEAHGAEDEARKAFSFEISNEALSRLIKRASGDDAAFLRAYRLAAQDDSDTTLLNALIGKASVAGRSFGDAASEFLTHLRDLLFFDTTHHGRGYERVELWLSDEIRRSETYGTLTSYAAAMSNAAEKLVGACQELIACFEDDNETNAAVQRDIASLALELKELLATCEILFHDQGDQGNKYAFAASLNRRAPHQNDVIQALLLQVGEALNEKLYARTNAIVFTSATMTIANSFELFRESLGLEKTTRELQLGSSYNFDEHMEIYVIDDIPEPSNEGYLEALQAFLVDAHVAQEGSMLTLFTNRKEMEKCFEMVQPALKSHDLRLVCQKWGLSAKGLRDDFLSDEHLSLFALKSFWEGFDAPGSTLKGVIIPKLPFAKPTDPLSCERARRDDQAWRRYVLPAAIIETRQAAGRLIRKADDTGVLVLADSRLVKKRYGKIFLNSLPSKNITICSAKAAVEAITRFRLEHK